MREVRISWPTDDGETNVFVKECDDEEIVDLMRTIEDQDFVLED